MDDSGQAAHKAWVAVQSLVAALVERGVLTREDADTMLSEAERKGGETAKAESLKFRSRLSGL